MAEHKKVFTEEETVRYKRVFNVFDINKDGVIDAKELAAVAKVLGYDVNKDKIMVRNIHSIAENEISIVFKICAVIFNVRPIYRTLAVVELQSIALMSYVTSSCDKIHISCDIEKYSTCSMNKVLV